MSSYFDRMAAEQDAMERCMDMICPDFGEQEGEE